MKYKSKTMCGQNRKEGTLGKLILFPLPKIKIRLQNRKQIHQCFLNVKRFQQHTARVFHFGRQQQFHLSEHSVNWVLQS